MAGHVLPLKQNKKSKTFKNKTQKSKIQNKKKKLEFFTKNGIILVKNEDINTQHTQESTQMCEHTKFTWIGYFKKFVNGDIDYINRYRCDDCGCEWNHGD